MHQPDTAQFFTTLRLLFFVLLGGQALFGAVVFWLIRTQGAGEGPVFTSYGFLAVIMLGWMAISSFVLYRQRLRRGAAIKEIPQKLSHYRTSSIFRWAMLEMGNLAVIGIAFLESNIHLLWLFAIGLAVFLLTMPSKEAFGNDYGENL